MVSKKSLSNRRPPTTELDHEIPQVESGGATTLPDKPWRQWHTAMRTPQAAPLQVSTGRRPQWGRYMYLAIILLIAAAVTKLVFAHVFWYSAAGVIAGQRYNVSSIHPATVQRVLVQPSSRVQAGQPLLQLASPELQNQLARDNTRLAHLQHQAVTSSTANKVASLRAQKDSLRSQVEGLETTLNTELRQIRSLKTLVAQGAANTGDLLQLRAQQAQTRAQYASTHAQLEGVRHQLHNISASRHEAGANTPHALIASLQQQRDHLRAELKNLTLKAPVSGRVARLNVRQGSVLQPGDSAVVIVSGNERHTYLFFSPAAQDRLHVGQKLSVTGPDGQQLQMRVTNIYPSLQDAPIDVVPQADQNAPKVVVAAEPLAGQHWPGTLRSGTPINSRIPRWATPAHWMSQVGQGLASLGTHAQNFFHGIFA